MDAGQEGCRAGGIQDRRDAGQEGCRTTGMQDRRDAGQEGCRTKGIQDRRDEDRRCLYAISYNINYYYSVFLFFQLASMLTLCFCQSLTFLSSAS